ncbi:hypothetical protein [Rubritalea marina]|uniref:hypothetical protein n=1 Tax=Rubritalea marina TaxID=361055 RepID=UPI00037B4670|nr:hypothetical protein [Rubritalea marina]
MRRVVLKALCALHFFLLSAVVSADDAGLITARIFELSEQRYSVEVDVAPQLQSVLSEPIFPDGFEGGGAEYSKRGAMLHVSYSFSGDRMLDAEDVLLLPWGRTGALVYFTDQNGTETSAMFLNDLVGIPVVMADLKMDGSPSSAWGDVLQGLQGGWTTWAFSLAWLAIGFGMVGLAWRARLLAFCSGVLAFLVLGDFVDHALNQVSLVVLTGLAALFVLRCDGKRVAGIVAIAAFLSGFLQPVGESHLYSLGACLSALSLTVLGGLIGRAMQKQKRWIELALGAGVFAGMLWGYLHPPISEKDKATVEIAQRVSPSAKAAAPRRLNEPVMCFINVEPYEIRVEVMCSAKSMQQELGLELADPRFIGVAELENFKQKVQSYVGSLQQFSINGKLVQANGEQTDFLTLGAAGAYARTKAVVENLETAIVGVSFSYLVDAPVEELGLQWSKLPFEGTAVPCSVMTPSTTQGYTLGSENLEVLWKDTGNAIKQTQVRVTESSMPEWAPLSLLCLFAVFLRKPNLSLALVGIGILSFPIVRVQNPWVSPLDAAEAEEVVESLLENVYRSFDFRREGMIYDQLAKSVEGEQLREIYLDQRKALELEKRGGARARVEAIEMGEVGNVLRSEDGVAVTAQWKVRGSVNHFGHTHYRQNAYRATLVLVVDENTWKISDVEVHEEERVY